MCYHGHAMPCHAMQCSREAEFSLPFFSFSFVFFCFIQLGKSPNPRLCGKMCMGRSTAIPLLPPPPPLLYVMLCVVCGLWFVVGIHIGFAIGWVGCVVVVAWIDSSDEIKPQQREEKGWKRRVESIIQLLLPWPFLLLLSYSLLSDA